MSRPMLRPAMVASMAILALAGCAPVHGPAAAVQGEGPMTSESRATGPFHRIHVGDGLRLDARMSGTTSVSVAAQANLLPLISTTVADGELEVSLAARSVSSQEPLTVTVVTPALEDVRLDTGAAGTLDVTAPLLELDVTGGASVAASGWVGSLDLHADLGGSADLAGVRVDDATVSIEDGGRATVAADASVAGVVGPGGNLVLGARPPTIRLDVRDGGTLVDG